MAKCINGRSRNKFEFVTIIIIIEKILVGLFIEFLGAWRVKQAQFNI